MYNNKIISKSKKVKTKDKKNQDYQEDDCDKSYNSEVKVE